jgi:hypothetical protein
MMVTPFAAAYDPSAMRNVAAEGSWILYHQPCRTSQPSLGITMRTIAATVTWPCRMSQPMGRIFSTVSYAMGYGLSIDSYAERRSCC